MGGLKSLSKKSIIQYSLFATPLSFAGMPLYIHAPDFYAAQFGAPLATIGTILLCLRLFDAVQDPIIGKLSDRFASKRLGIMLVAALLLVVSFYALFNPSSDNLLPWFAVSMLFATTAFSVIGINLNTVGGLWSSDTYQKTRITTMREAFGLVGLLLAVMLPAMLMQLMPAVEAFMWVAAVLAVVTIIAATAFAKWYRKNATQDTYKREQKTSLLNSIKHVPASTRRFFIIYGISMFASSMPALLVMFFIRDLIGAEDLIGLFLLLYFLAGIAGMPLWQRLSKIRGKGHAWLAAMLLAVVSFVWAFFLGAGDIWQYGIICVLSGIAFGADLALPPAILADQIQAHESQGQAAAQFGVFAFLAKTALALASFIGLSVLDIAQFSPAAENGPNALLMLSMLYALLPCVIKLFSACLLYQSKDTYSNGGNHEKISHYSSIRRSDHA